jgi:hypothetical protein
LSEQEAQQYDRQALVASGLYIEEASDGRD